MIIAEIGQNFLGDMFLARELIELAKENGADLVKFQLYDSKKLYGKKHKEELGFDDARWLFESGQSLGMEVFFSVFDVERVKWCEEIGVKRYKIACDKITDELFNSIPTGKQLIVSYSKDWNRERSGDGLLCVPRYPAWVSDYCLGSVDFEYAYDGISDHTIGLDCAKIALARGAKIIERHFAIDHKTGVDAPWSMDASELRELKRWEQICEQLSL